MTRRRRTGMARAVAEGRSREGRVKEAMMISAWVLGSSSAAYLTPSGPLMVPIEKLDTRCRNGGIVIIIR
jgi:hypothetical protein